MSFRSILEKHRTLAFSEVDKGTRFERLMQGFLQTHPIYTEEFSTVWLWNEFPYRDQFGGHDVGIDLVAFTQEKEYWAIQCKCYQEDTVIDKKAVDSFLATSSRRFSGDSETPISFSRRVWISTTNNWGKNAEEVLENQNPAVTRINLTELENAPVDWEKLDAGVFGRQARTAKKTLREHQREAVTKTQEYFRTADRGKLIMACGTGKTYTALKIAETETDGTGLILVLVPSIALISQTLREWSAEAENPIKPLCVCSDAKVSREVARKEDSFEATSIVDLALPASTNEETVIRQFAYLDQRSTPGMTVVFSTYQSIDVISRVQKRIEKEFDLIICDEAHRTTGVTFADENESHFVKVHDNAFIPAKKRIYMTATPRIYSESSKTKAEINDAILCSMDDESIYGKEIYHLGFGKAVEQKLLTDYRVLVLTMSDHNVSPSIRQMIHDKDQALTSENPTKLIGCINSLSKQMIGDDGIVQKTDPQPMKRAVAFCQNIKISKHITESFNEVTHKYLEDLPAEKRGRILQVQAKHIDGSMGSTTRDGLLSWLKHSTAQEGQTPASS